MSVLDFCQWLQSTTVGTSIRESLWVFPIINGIHVLGLALSIGIIVWFDLRLAGWSMRHKPISELWGQLLPLVDFGFHGDVRERWTSILVGGSSGVEQCLFQNQADIHVAGGLERFGVPVHDLSEHDRVGQVACPPAASATGRRPIDDLSGHGYRGRPDDGLYVLTEVGMK